MPLQLSVSPTMATCLLVEPAWGGCRCRGHPDIPAACWDVSGHGFATDAEGENQVHQLITLAPLGWTTILYQSPQPEWLWPVLCRTICRWPPSPSALPFFVYLELEALLASTVQTFFSAMAATCWCAVPRARALQHHPCSRAQRPFVMAFCIKVKWISCPPSLPACLLL